MKAKIAITALGLLLAGPVLAQSCAAPTNIAPPPAAGVTLPGDTCASTNTLGTLCGLFGSPENDVVFRFETTSPYTATTFALTNNTPAWNAAMFRLGAACGGGADCINDADVGGAGANESFSVAGLPDGVHHLIVSSSPEAGGCGAFTLNINGTLPVELQGFSVD
jgi:hypothetical protein